MKVNLISVFFILSTFSLHAQWAEHTLQQMSLDEKIGQLLMIGIPCNPEDKVIANNDHVFPLHFSYEDAQQYATDMIRNYHIGGILYICQGHAQPQVEATNYFQRSSKLPLLIAQDFEPGLVRLFDVVNYPRARVVAQAHDLDLIYRIGKQIGLQAKRLGVHIVFAPVVDVQTNEKNPVINSRSFGSDPELVAAHGTAFMRGVQDAGVIACAKHFPGHGDTSVDSHLGLPVLEHDMDRLREIELVPFKTLINAGVQSVMLGHLLVKSIDAHNPASLSPACIKELLQKKLGFKELIFPDALRMKAITPQNTAALKALLAGCTVALFPEDVPASIAIIKKAAESGEFSEDELNEKVLLILQAKEKLGLHKGCLVSENDVLKDICTQQALAIQAVFLN